MSDTLDFPGATGNLAFLRSMINPRDAQSVAPAYNEGGPASVIQSVALTLNYPVKPIMPWNSSTNANREGIQDTQGLILWFTQDGTDNIYHYGIVPASPGHAIVLNTPSAVAPDPVLVARGLDIRQHFVGRPFGAGVIVAPVTPNQYFPGFTFSWDAATILPRSGRDSIINLSKDLSIDFSRARLISGLLAVEGSSVPIGSTALSGTLSWGILADARDASRPTSTDANAYSGAVVVDQSFSQKDARVNSSIARGHISIVGPDITPQYSAPRQMTTDTLNAEYEIEVLSSSASTDSGYGSSAFAPHFAAWISPVESTFFIPTTNVANAPPANYNRIITDQIAETGVLDVKMVIPWSSTMTFAQFAAVGAETAYGTLFVNAIHIFCTCDSEGDVHYNLFSETQSETRQITVSMAKVATSGLLAPVTTVGADPNLDMSTSTFSFEPRRFRTSYVDQGKYIGTYINVSSSRSLGNIGNRVAGAKAIITSRNNDLIGRLGPVHVIRWDSVSVGQTLAISGRINVDVVAEGRAAGLLTRAMEGTQYASNPNMAYFMHRLWNSSSEIFKRCYTIDEYREAVNQAAEVLSNSSSLQNYIQGRVSNPDAIQASGASAGVLGALKRGLGYLTQGADIARNVAQIGGGVLDQFGGNAAGQFGIGNLAGQFRGRY
jgi:hypothetical protein